ncbi:MAG: ubiquitin-specific protease otu1 [Trichoglossum hirsutum]|jgi:ubiquitin thioesterase OTU1|nr:MAG: ubiquitin-specific protease otu1 [Trichoglossum hirsutum]
MRIKLQTPSGSSIITLPASATVGDLLSSISEQTSLQNFEIKSGFPPKLLRLDTHPRSKPLVELDERLDGGQLLVSLKDGHGDDATVGGSSGAADIKAPIAKRPTLQSSVSSPPLIGAFNTQSAPTTPKPLKAPPLSLSRKQIPSLESDPPEIPLPSHGATLLMRIMPDDNSCLFRAIGSAVLGSLDSMNELRSLVASAIQEDPETYPEVVLGERPDKYCEWIQMESSWGGGIELAILSQHFDIEICSIDVQSLRVDRYNEGRPTRCIIVYSGIHYDTICYSPSDPPHTHAYAPPDFDTKVFNADDDTILAKAVELCRILQANNYYTDTAGFIVKCNTCGATFKGEKGATAHNKETGHVDFSEA